MPIDYTRPKPKPIKDTSPDPYEVVLKTRAGSDGALMALVNHLRAFGKVKQGLFLKHADGSVDQTITLYLDDLARHYEPVPERPYTALPGVVYLVEGINSGKYKIGGTDDIRRRLAELERDFAEEFRLIHIIHAENWKAREKDTHDYLKKHGLHVEREFFALNQDYIDWFISQPNEF